MAQADKIIELDELLDQLCERQLSEDEARRLGELLRRNDALVQRYVETINVHTTMWLGLGQRSDALLNESGVSSLLSERPEGSSAQKVSEPFVDPVEASGDALPKIEVKPGILSRRHKRFDSIHWQRHKIRFNAMTAVLTALAWIGFGCFMWLSTLPDDSRPQRGGVNVNFVARITGQFEHRWAQSTRGIPWHAFLVPGERLHLVEGFIEITFYDGAKVLLAAPAEFVVDSRGAGTLDVGKLTATVPQQAIGFVVDTPSMRIVDLGTQFGVEVDRSGSVEVHVLVGSVESSSKFPGSNPAKPMLIAAGEAIRISPGAHRVERIAAEPERFPVTGQLAIHAIPAASTIIIDDDLDGNGDASAISGTITTAWAGWGGVLPDFGFVPSGLGPLADDVDAGFPDSPLTRLSDVLPAPFFNSGETATVTYGGSVAEGTYTVLLQVIDWNNATFATPSLNFAGLTPTSSTTTTPASGDDEIWSFTYVVGAGDTGSNLSLSITAGGTELLDNSGVDHVQVYFVPIPEPPDAEEGDH